MTKIKVSKGIKIRGNDVDFSIESGGSYMTLEIQRLSTDQRDEGESISLSIDDKSIDEIIKTLEELRSKIK